MSKYEVFSGPYFLVFGRNTGKCGPEKTPYLDTFHAVRIESDMGPGEKWTKTITISQLITYSHVWSLTLFWCFQGVEKGCTGNEWVNVSESEFSTLYFIAEYVSKKEGLSDNMNCKQPLATKSCEFTIELLRRNLVHQTKDIFDLAKCRFFKKRKWKK